MKTQILLFILARSLAKLSILRQSKNASNCKYHAKLLIPKQPVFTKK